MQTRSVGWSVPWTVLVIFAACAGRTPAPVAPALPPPATAPSSFKTIEAQQIILRDKDGAVRGTLSGEGLELTDATGNKIVLSLGASAKIAMTNATGDITIALEADPDTGAIVVAGKGASALISTAKDTSSMSVSAGGRRITAGVETDRPLADLQFFDANEKRRVSIGLNSNGDPRLSLYDANETRRLYGILQDDVPQLDLNDPTGTSALSLFGADAARGSGMEVSHKARTTRVGVGADGKPLK